LTLSDISNGHKPAAKSASSRRKPAAARMAAIAVARALDAMKAEDVVVLDVGAISPVTEYYVLATGTAPRHVAALAQEAVHTLRETGVRPSATEGFEQGTWALADYGPLVVHVFDPRARKFYDLDMLWGDGPKVRWQAPKRRAATEGGRS
jgi:ribosome-associated protein